MVELIMGSYLMKPITEKHNEGGCGNGLSYGISSMQGWRTEMEDAHCALVGLPQGLEDWSFFAVFDGHCGADVSAHCAENLIETILQSEAFCSITNAGCDNSAVDEVERTKSSIRDSFLKLDEKMRNSPSGEITSGSTAVCTLISSTHFYFANCGDSRAVLSRDKQPFFVTKDHDPCNQTEKDRIQKAGGYVNMGRVNGNLAMSRALGDYEYKSVEGKGPCEQMVSPEPAIDVVKRDDDLDEFLVLACDGIWDVVHESVLCDNIRYMLQVTNDLEYICNSVLDACLSQYSRDNMSIILVTLPGAPKVSEEIIQRDEEINTLLETCVKEIISSSRNVVMKEVMRRLIANDVIKQAFLPLPSEALHFKYTFVEGEYNKLKTKFASEDETDTDEPNENNLPNESS